VTVLTFSQSELLGGLQIVVSEQGATTVIALEGEWDLAQQPATRDAVRKALERPPERLVLDLSRLSFIDSSGVHGVIDLSMRAARQGIGLAIIPGPRAVQRVFELCGLTERLPFIDTASSE
jgi:anti-anti-sigma factor